MSRPIHNLNVEFVRCQWFRLLPALQRRRLALACAAACPAKPPRSFRLESIDSPFHLCARSPITECRREYLLIDQLPVPVHVCLQPAPIEHKLSKSLAYDAICVKQGRAPTVLVKGLIVWIGGRNYPVRTTWDALAATVTECVDLDEARCIASDWLTTTAGLDMHIRVDDWRDRILSPHELEDATKRHSKAARLLKELANPAGYFRTLEEFHEAKRLIFL